MPSEVLSMNRPKILILLAALAALGAVWGCGSTEERIAEHRAKANEYFEAEQWAEAKIEFLNLLDAAPDDAEAHYKMGQVLFNLEDPREGLWQYREAVRLAPDNSEWRLALAQILFVFRSYDDSLDHANAVLEEQPENVDALLLRAGLRNVRGESDGMLEDIDRALGVDPDHKSALAIKAQALARKGDTAGAEEFLRRLIEVAPTAQNHTTLSRFLSQLGRRDEALAMSKRAVEVAGDEDEAVAAYMNLANQHLNQANVEETFDVLQKARTAYPNSEEVLLTLARLHQANGEREKAEEILEQYVDSRPEDPGPLLVLADYYRALGEPDRAIAAVERAIRLEPEHETALLRQAEYLHSGSADEAPRKRAWDIVEGVLQRNPKSSLAHFTEGKFHLMEERYEEATISLRRVLDEQDSANAHVLLGNAYHKMGQTDLARSEYQQAIQSDAQNASARLSLSGLFLEAGENELAVREARTALRLRPADAGVRMILAQALVRLNRHAQAREALEPIGDGQMLKPPNRLQLAQLYRLSNDLPTSRRILTELIGEPGLRTRVQGELVNCDLQARSPADAISRLDAWIAEEPDNAELYLYRGRVRLGLKRDGKPAQPEQTEADLEAAVEKGVEGIGAHLVLAQFYVEADRSEEAIAVLRTAQARDPEDTRAPFQLAGIYERLGRLDEARRSYEDVLRLDQDRPVVKNNLAWLLANAESPTDAELDRAMQLAQDAREAMPDNPSVADTLGWVMLKKDIPSAAISLFHEAIAQYPESHPLRGTVRYHLARAYERNGDVDKAIDELIRALDEVPSFAERTATERLLRQLRSS